jgi:ribonucleoside-diphosphate reductase alpha chain
MNIYDAERPVLLVGGPPPRGADGRDARVDHPDIEAFIQAKQPPPEAKIRWEMLDKISPEDPDVLAAPHGAPVDAELKGFNISVALTDDFMRALTEPAIVVPISASAARRTRPSTRLELWETLMQSTWAWAEPGALFMDTINRMNNLWYCEKIAATNPCGEQPLPPDGACLLGSFNLVKYLVRWALARSCTYIDMDQLRRGHPPRRPGHGQRRRPDQVPASRAGA